MEGNGVTARDLGGNWLGGEWPIYKAASHFKWLDLDVLKLR